MQYWKSKILYRTSIIINHIADSKRHTHKQKKEKKEKEKRIVAVLLSSLGKTFFAWRFILNGKKMTSDLQCLIRNHLTGGWGCGNFYLGKYFLLISTHFYLLMFPNNIVIKVCKFIFFWVKHQAKNDFLKNVESRLFIFPTLFKMYVH